MVDPDVTMCPECFCPVSCFRRVFLRDGQTGDPKGSFLSCDCGSFTQNGTGVLNIKTEVAEEWGIKRRDPEKRTKAPELRFPGLKIRRKQH